MSVRVRRAGIYAVSVAISYFVSCPEASPPTTQCSLTLL